MWGHVESCRSVEEIYGYKVGGLNVVKNGEWVPRTPLKKTGRLQCSHIPHSKVLENIYYQNNSIVLYYIAHYFKIFSRRVITSFQEPYIFSFHSQLIKHCR